jgi:UDP-N-acetylmuramyl pentapeptide phosphotransferase/UDP-N-acetylglucosamine-1-phosphate transferase
MAELELAVLQPSVAQAAAFLATVAACLALMLTTKWHGRLSLDTTVGLQKFHSAPTPRIGGLATLAGLVAAYGVSSEAVRQLLGPLLIASLPAFTAGLLEDLTKKASVRVRLAGTIFSGFVAWYLTGMALTRTGVPGVDHLLSYVPLSVLFTAVAIGGVANAVNIIDGFNGLAGGVLSIIFAGLGFIALGADDHALAATCGVLAACSLGFTLINWPFGKIFLGDGGAYQLGFAVGWIAVILVARNPEIPPWAPLMVCAYPVLEVAFSMVRKTRRAGYNPAVPDRVHLHMLVHRRVVRHWLPSSSRALQNGMTSPFAWLYAAALAAWGCLFAKDTFHLIAGLLAAALLYWSLYTRLTRFRWWPFTMASLPGERAPTGAVGSGQLTTAVVRPGRLPARGYPPREPIVTRLPPRLIGEWDAPPARRSAVLIYGILGFSTFLTMIEPAPFEVIALPLVLASWIRHVLSDSRPYTRSSAALVLLLVLFSLLQLLPVLGVAQNMLNAAQYAGVTAALIMIGIHLGHLFGTGDARFAAFLRWYCVAALLSALVAMGSLYFSVSGSAPEWLMFEGRPKAFFKDPNVLGPYLVPAVVAFLYQAAHTRSFGKPFYLMCALVCALGIVATASRGAWLNLAVAVAVFTILGRTRAMTIALVAATMGLVLVIAVGPASLSTLAPDLFDLFAGRMQLQDYDADRFVATRQAWELGLQYPMGVGPGDITSRMGLAAMDPHNTYLRIWAENGPAALLLFLVIVGSASIGTFLAWFNTSGRTREAMACALALLVGVLVNAAVVDALHWRHFWVILGLCVFASHALCGRLNNYRSIHSVVRQ